jgi:hypothetical protein
MREEEPEQREGKEREEAAAAVEKIGEDKHEGSEQGNAGEDAEASGENEAEPEPPQLPPQSLPLPVAAANCSSPQEEPAQAEAPNSEQAHGKERAEAAETGEKEAPEEDEEDEEEEEEEEEDDDDEREEAEQQQQHTNQPTQAPAARTELASHPTAPSPQPRQSLCLDADAQAMLARFPQVESMFMVWFALQRAAAPLAGSRPPSRAAGAPPAFSALPESVLHTLLAQWWPFARRTEAHQAQSSTRPLHWPRKPPVVKQLAAAASPVSATGWPFASQRPATLLPSYREAPTHALFICIDGSRDELLDLIGGACRLMGGWFACADAHSYRWNIKWSWRQSREDVTKLLAWQRVNHFPGNQQLTRKDLLQRNVARLRDLPGFRHARSFDIVPTTFVMPRDYSAFAAHFAEAAPRLGARNFWIVKPTNSSRGRGITLINEPRELRLGEHVIVQRYVANPLLLNGFKFDLRLYVLVTSFQPLEAFLYGEGFARMCTAPFSLSPERMHDRFVHLTNYAIQKDGSPSAELPDSGERGGSKISLSYLKQLLRARGVDTALLWARICAVVLKSLVCVEDRIAANANSFELFGYDVLVDDELRPWLLEVNASPSLAIDTPLDRQVKQQLIVDTLSVVDPLPFDRAELAALLERKVRTGSWFEEPLPVTPLQREQAVAEAVTRVLCGRRPRAYGEEPRAIGSYERLAPGPMYTEVAALKRAAIRGVESRSPTPA